MGTPSAGDQGRSPYIVALNVDELSTAHPQYAFSSLSRGLTLDKASGHAYVEVPATSALRLELLNRSQPTTLRELVQVAEEATHPPEMGTRRFAVDSDDLPAIFVFLGLDLEDVCSEPVFLRVASTEPARLSLRRLREALGH